MLTKGANSYNKKETSYTAIYVAVVGLGYTPTTFFAGHVGPVGPKKGGKMYNVYTIFRSICSVVYCLIALGVTMLAGAIVWELAAWHHDNLLGYFQARKLCGLLVILVLIGILIVYSLKQLLLLL